MFSPLFSFFSSGSALLALKILYYLSYVFVPVFLIILVIDLWLQYRRAQSFAKQTHLLLEVKLPKEIFKSPRAMEFFLNGLYQPFGEGNWYLRWWKGSTRPWFALEIVSIDSFIHFFIWTRKSFKSAIEANLYSQYPGIEIFEVPDYTLPINFDPETVGLFAAEFGLNKPDAYPIKTYVDYGMDKDPKEEFKLDPMTPLIEFLGSLGNGHQVWIQIVLRAHINEDKDRSTGKMVDLKWRKAAEKEIEDIIAKTKGEKDENGKIVPGTGRRLTDVESETIKALDRSTSKQGYDVGIRVIYTAKKDVFNSDNIAGIIGGMMHYNSNNLNSFKLSVAGGKYSTYPWQDRKKRKTNRQKQRMLDAYKRRAFFHKPYKSPHFVLNTEELATIFHFPGGVSNTPTFSRIESKKVEAPGNLPI